MSVIAIVLFAVKNSQLLLVEVYIRIKNSSKRISFTTTNKFTYFFIYFLKNI